METFRHATAWPRGFAGTSLEKKIAMFAKPYLWIKSADETSHATRE
jgi:hypothetical protein